MALIRTADIVIVGGGIVGAATARALTSSGRSVVLLERFSLGNKNGSSHGRSRIFRLSYPDPEYVEMARQAHSLWRRLETDSGESLLRTMGALDVGEGIETNAKSLETAGIPYELTEGKTISKRIRSVALDAYEPVLFQPDGGILSAERSITAFARVAVEGGVEIREGEPATALEAGADGVRVKTAHGVFDAGVAVVAFSVGPEALIWSMVLLFAYQQLENFLIAPRVMNRAVDLSPASVIIALMVGGSLAGLVGALLALPLAALLKIVFRDYVVQERIDQVRAEAANGEGGRRTRRRGRSRPLP